MDRTEQDRGDLADRDPGEIGGEQIKRRDRHADNQSMLRPHRSGSRDTSPV